MHDWREQQLAAYRALAEDAAAQRGASLAGWKPLHSEALAVHPEQIAEAVEDARNKGVPTDFDGEGRPVFTSRAHRREYMKRYGFYDRDGGYADAQRGESDARWRDKLPDPGYY